MAIIQCPECTKDVSDKAPTCPHCGVPLTGSEPAEQTPAAESGEATTRKAKPATIVLIVLLCVLAILIAVNSNDTQDQKAAADPRKEKIKKCFSQWDGAHKTLERHIKARMKNPDSYDHVKTEYRDNGDHLLVTTTYRGENAFGGTVTESVSAKTGLNCGVVEFLN